MAQNPQVTLFAFASPDAAAAWQDVNDGVMGGVSDGRFRITERQPWSSTGPSRWRTTGDSPRCDPGPGHSDCRLAIRWSHGFVATGVSTS